MKRWGVVRQVFIALLLACASVAAMGVVGAFRWNTTWKPYSRVVGPTHEIGFYHRRGIAGEVIEWRRGLRGPDLGIPLGDPPLWSAPGSASPDRFGQVPATALQIATGWPMRSFIGEMFWKPNWEDDPREPQNVITVHELDVPYRPILPSLCFNLAFHGILWWSGIALPGRVRRAIVRHRRKDNGLCMNCAYDVYDQPSGSKCPECGEARW